MTYFDALILGVVEGFTEFLPISSTGHLILVGNLLEISQSEFLKSFEIIIQFGAILAVVVLYFKSFFDVENLKKILIGFIPTAIIGLAFYKIVKEYLIGNSGVVLLALFVGGLFLIIFEIWNKGRELKDGAGIKNISVKQAFLIGLFQSIAIIPGVSRSATTIIGGMFLGIGRRDIVEYSFLLAVPTMLAASGLDLFKNWQIISSSGVGLLAVGFLVSFLVAIFSIKFLLNFVRNKTFISFGFYRVIIALVFFLILF